MKIGKCDQNGQDPHHQIHDYWCYQQYERLRQGQRDRDARRAMPRFVQSQRNLIRRPVDSKGACALRRAGSRPTLRVLHPLQ